MFALFWRQNEPLPGLSLQWRGPNLITQEWLERNALSTLSDIATKIAVISGPQGPKGDKGEKGEDGAIGGLPTVIDGGNF